MLRMMVVALVAALTGTTGGTDAAAAADMCPTGWMMSVEGFESGAMSGSGWCTEGPMSAGLDPGGTYARNGSYNAYLQTATPQWNALKRHVGLPDEPVCVTITGWVRTTGTVKDGRFGARAGRTTTVLAERVFGASDGYYTPVGPVTFRAQDEMTLYVGYHSPSGFTRVMVDDLLVVWDHRPPSAACA